MLRKLTFFLFVTSSTLCFGQEWSLQTMMEVKRIGNVVPSPDGQSALFEVKEETKPTLFLYEHHASKTKEIAKNAHSPAWSPNGEVIAYLNASTKQIELHTVKTGAVKQLTQLSGTITTFRWNPNGETVAFLVEPPKDREAISSIDEEEKPYQQLWIVSVDGKHLRQLSDASYHVGAGFFTNHFTFSPDGKEIIFPKMPSAEIDRWDEIELVKIELATDQITPFVPAPAVEPHFSPDGKWVAYLKQDPSWSFIEDVWVVPAEGGKPQPLAHTFNRDVLKIGALLGWSTDSRYVYVLDYRKTKAEVYALPVTGGAASVIPIEMPVITHAALGHDHQQIGFVGEGSSQPEEAYIYDLTTKKLNAITHLNGSLPLDAIARTEHIEYKAKDGLTLDALLTYPLNYEKEKPFPLLLVIHGGPCFFFREEFIGAPCVYPLATLASHGFGILRCNIRGSTGYGVTFRQANFADWGGKDFLDLMSGIDFLDEKKIIDPTQMGVMGWSYGGYMTSWIITQTNRFKAASVGAGLTNLISFTGTTDIPGFLPDYFGGEMWDKFDLYLEHSAIAHVKNVKTPTLIQHGKEDKRVPTSQGIEFYQALKRQGVPTQIMLFPRTAHGIKEPKLLLEAARANLTWFEHYVLGEHEL